MVDKGVKQGVGRGVGEDGLHFSSATNDPLAQTSSSSVAAPPIHIHSQTQQTQPNYKQSQTTHHPISHQVCLAEQVTQPNNL